MKRTFSFVLLATLFLAGLLHMLAADKPDSKSLPNKSNTKQLQQEIHHRKTPKPSLSKGMWWITKTHGLCIHMVDDPKDGPFVLPSDPDPYAEEIYYHKWEVVGQEIIGKDQCWVIDIKEFKSKLTCKARRKPPGYKLFVRVSDGSLAKEIKTKFSEDPFGKSQTSSTTWEKPIPVLFIEKRIAVIVPWFPKTWRSTVLAKQDKGGDSYDSDKGEILRQTTTTCASMESPGLQKMHVVLFESFNEKITVTQTWDSICPWYKECHIVKEGDMINTPWHSETIDWKGKAKSTPPAIQEK